MGADSLLPQPLTHARGLCAHLRRKCRGLREVPGTDNVPGTWMGVLHRVGKTAVFILPPKMKCTLPSDTHASRWLEADVAEVCVLSCSHRAATARRQPSTVELAFARRLEHNPDELGLPVIQKRQDICFL